MNKQEAIKKINLEMFAYPNLEPEEDDGPPIDFKNGYNAASKANIKIINQLNKSRGASWQDAIEVLEDHFSCEIPRNLDQVIEGFKSMSGLMNSVEFELDKRGSKLTSNEFVLEALERYKQKVKVPECVGKDLDAFTKARLKEDLVKDICLAVYDYGVGTPFDAATIEWCRKGNNLRTMIDAIWNGYEVEEEPKWVVKINNMYFLNWGEDGTCPTFVIDDAPGTKERAEKYESEPEAKSVAEIFGGTVEKV